ncbi:MAG: HEPN domain-containing protein [Verrucomicrobiota bacterium]|jgi:hypothetical protein
MKDPRLIEGQWYIFGDDQAAAYGTLRVEPESGLSLEVKIPRNLEDGAIRRPFGNFNCPETIHGIESQGQPITLLGCMGAESSYTDGLDSYRIRPLLGIVGGHFGKWNEITSQTVRADYSILDQWLRRSTIKSQHDSECMVFTQGPIPGIEVPLPDDEQIVITCGYTHQLGIGELHLTQRHSAHFNFPKPRPVTEIRAKYVHVFRQMLTFFTGSEVFIDEIEFAGGQFSKNKLINSTLDPASAKRELSYGRRLVDYLEIADRFPEIVASWFAYHSEMEPIFDLYFSACWNTEMPVTTKFLLLAQALEAYHSRSPRYESAVQKTEDFRHRVDAILAGVAEDTEKTWLQKKLCHANQKTLAQRLDELIGTHHKEVASFIPDSAAFAKTIRHTRNYLTHFDEELRRRKKVPEITSLTKIRIQMKALLEICFLRDLKLPEIAVSRVVARTQNIKFVSLESFPSNS